MCCNEDLEQPYKYIYIYVRTYIQEADLTRAGHGLNEVVRGEEMGRG